MKHARALAPAERIRVIDRGDWAIIRVPPALLTEQQRYPIVAYIRQLPFSDCVYSSAIESWCLRSEWLEPVVELIEHVVGTKVPVEG